MTSWDGDGVYGQFSTNTGTHRISDGNGAAGGCGNATFVPRVRERAGQLQFLGPALTVRPATGGQPRSPGRHGV